MTRSSNTESQRTHLWTLAALFAAALTWSAIGPRDRFTWGLEVAPTVAAAVILIVTAPAARP